MRQDRTDHQLRGLQAGSACKWVRCRVGVGRREAGVRRGEVGVVSSVYSVMAMRAAKTQGSTAGTMGSVQSRAGQHAWGKSGCCVRHRVAGEGLAAGRASDLAPARLRRQRRRGRHLGTQAAAPSFPSQQWCWPPPARLPPTDDAFARHAYIVPYPPLAPPSGVRPGEATGGFRPRPRARAVLRSTQ